MEYTIGTHTRNEEYIMFCYKNYIHERSCFFYMIYYKIRFNVDGNLHDFSLKPRITLRNVYRSVLICNTAKLTRVAGYKK